MTENHIEFLGGIMNESVTQGDSWDEGDGIAHSAARVNESTSIESLMVLVVIVIEVVALICF
jgi:hypothetical protein